MHFDNNCIFCLEKNFFARVRTVSPSYAYVLNKIFELLKNLKKISKINSTYTENFLKRIYKKVWSYSENNLRSDIRLPKSDVYTIFDLPIDADAKNLASDIIDTVNARNGFDLIKDVGITYENL